MSPHWRPGQYAEGIAVADALTWHHARSDLPAIVRVPTEAVALGLLFPIHTATLRLTSETDHQAARHELCRHAATADHLGL